MAFFYFWACLIVIVIVVSYSNYRYRDKYRHFAIGTENGTRVEPTSHIRSKTKKEARLIYCITILLHTKRKEKITTTNACRNDFSSAVHARQKARTKKKSGASGYGSSNSICLYGNRSFHN